MDLTGDKTPQGLMITTTKTTKSSAKTTRVKR